ncbi:MAG: hypothetical protein GPJ51_10090 [Candidatus Heimdallarchaeota archaeon]|nr:hypothetical protein [Candidatus Heimdallarchaeota archaeon]
MSKSLLILFNNGETESNFKSHISGGKLLWSGNNGFELIGKGKEEWDKVLLVKFRRIKFLQETIKKTTEIRI